MVPAALPEDVGFLWGAEPCPLALVPDPRLHRKVSYAIGVAAPLSISIFTYGTSQKTERELLDVVNKNFDLRPGVIVRSVNYPALVGRTAQLSGKRSRRKDVQPQEQGVFEPWAQHMHTQEQGVWSSG